MICGLHFRKTIYNVPKHIHIYPNIDTILPYASKIIEKIKEKWILMLERPRFFKTLVGSYAEIFFPTSQLMFSKISGAATENWHKSVKILISAAVSIVRLIRKVSSELLRFVTNLYFQFLSKRNYFFISRKNKQLIIRKFSSSLSPLEIIIKCMAYVLSPFH